MSKMKIVRNGTTTAVLNAIANTTIPENSEWPRVTRHSLQKRLFRVALTAGYDSVSHLLDDILADDMAGNSKIRETDALMLMQRKLRKANLTANTMKLEQGNPVLGRIEDVPTLFVPTVFPVLTKKVTDFAKDAEEQVDHSKGEDVHPEVEDMDGVNESKIVDVGVLVNLIEGLTAKGFKVVS